MRRGDHICSLYSSPIELADIVGEFLGDGLRRDQRCWYVASGDETTLVRTALQDRDVDVERELARGALRLIEGSTAYVVRGSFDPEAAIKVFNNAIEQACSEGFTGFRAAAEMSWALGRRDTIEKLIEYEALLRSLFANCRAIGLCLYDRTRMPLDVIDGALATHPIVRAEGEYRANQFYDPQRTSLQPADEQVVRTKLQQLHPSQE